MVIWSQTFLRHFFWCRYHWGTKKKNRSRGRPKGSLFNSYYTKVKGRALLLSLDCSTLPLIHTLYCWVLSKEASSTIFKVFGMTQPRIEPKSPRPLANTLPTVTMNHFKQANTSLYQIELLDTDWTLTSIIKQDQRGPESNGNKKLTSHFLKLWNWSLTTKIGGFFLASHEIKGSIYAM